MKRWRWLTSMPSYIEAAAVAYNRKLRAPVSERACEESGRVGTEIGRIAEVFKFIRKLFAHGVRYSGRVHIRDRRFARPTALFHSQQGFGIPIYANALTHLGQIRHEMFV